MLSTKRRINSLILLVIMLTVTEIRGNFVTLQNWTNLEYKMGEEDDYAKDENLLQFYKLRFRPARLFWNKLPQIELPQTEAPTEMMITESPAPPVTEPPVETKPPAPQPSMEPEPTMPASMEPMKPTKKPSTTRSSIMRPPLPYATTFSKRIKQQQSLLFGSPIEANLIQKQKHSDAASTKSKGKGFLSLFEVIKFPNIKCTVAMGDIRSMEGVCYHEFECKSLGGIPTERCAEGVGVCCVFLTGCGDTTTQQVVYFESPNYPNVVREMMICVLIVNVRENVQQLRLDFLMFELSRPTNGDCVDDQFIISGFNANFQVPVLCGINTDQHHIGDALEKKVYLSVFVKTPTGGRSFNIKVTQLEDNLAPDGCLQYYTEPEGILKSFNYDIDGTIVTNQEATYLNNLNYVICMLRAKDTCSITYRTEQFDGDVPDFQIINKDESDNDLVPDGQAGAGIFNCPDDFIAINSVRLCGERFNDGTDNEDFTMNAPIKNNAAGPIILPFRTDAEYVGHGFRLLYKQEACA